MFHKIWERTKLRQTGRLESFENNTNKDLIIYSEDITINEKKINYNFNCDINSNLEKCLSLEAEKELWELRNKYDYKQ